MDWPTSTVLSLWRIPLITAFFLSIGRSFGGPLADWFDMLVYRQIWAPLTIGESCWLNFWGPEHPRTNGWSLLGVMSDWQRGVDWLLASEYCKCRFWLDLCWCRRRAGAKSHSLCGLWGVERQVGLARWSRWPNETKCGPHGGKKSKTK
jgi:hypothetical protein